MTPNLMLSSLVKLAQAVPKFAPDFSKQDTAEVWVTSLLREAWDAQTFGEICKTVIRTCDQFPSIAQIVSIANGSAVVDDKALATQQAEALWVRIRLISPHYEPDRFMDSLTPAQRAAVPSRDSARALAHLTEGDRTTCIAQWRTAIEGYLSRESSSPDVLALRPFAPAAKAALALASNSGTLNQTALNKANP